MVQILKPTGDIAVSNYQGYNPVVTEDLYENIDEGYANHEDNLDSIYRPSASGYYECSIEEGGDPGVHTGHVLRWCWASALADSTKFILKCGSTEIASWTEAVVADMNIHLVEKTLSEAQAANITDYTDLSIRVEHVSGYNASIHSLELEIPDAGQAPLDATVAVTAGTNATLSVIRGIVASVSSSASASTSIYFEGQIDLQASVSATSTFTAGEFRVYNEVAAQTLVPISDIANNDYRGWNPSLSSNIYVNVDEGCDGYTSDEIYRNNGGGYYECLLTSGVDPGIHTGHKVRWVWREYEGYDDDTRFILKCGSTVIATWDESAPVTTQTVEKTLSEAQAANITDYTDLRIRLEDDGAEGEASIFAMEVELPAYSSGYTLEFAALSLSSLSDINAMLSLLREIVASVSATAGTNVALTVITTNYVDAEAAVTATAGITGTLTIQHTEYLEASISVISSVIVTVCTGVTYELEASVSASSGITGSLNHVRIQASVGSELLFTKSYLYVKEWTEVNKKPTLFTLPNYPSQVNVVNQEFNNIYQLLNALSNGELVKIGGLYYVAYDETTTTYRIYYKDRILFSIDVEGNVNIRGTVQSL